MMENIHSETYFLLINTYIKEPAQREYLGEWAIALHGMYESCQV